MKLSLYTVIVILTLSCNQNKAPEAVSHAKEKAVQLVLIEDNLTPTVDIRSFTLITSDPGKDSVEAREILQLKRNLPLAMQKKDSSLFSHILASSFTYRGEDEFYSDKRSYIQNRIHASWTIDTVKYQNLVLQFFEGIAMITYRNTLSGTDDNGKPDIEHYNWAEVYVKEDGHWKIKSIHEIESRVEYPAK